ncbi:MAG: Lrp/AsnC family transcriptional regulator [Thermoplasmata archaeon]|nr:MAG: Lrp/AsnC family transcriptional regulator [Thermoplasmata archaeon]RLF36037.1 MAG: Lrp/AsnC family transcriptional regulator [Thermoplasmata archaeon]
MFDEKDKIILQELKKNSRRPTKNIATDIGIPRVTVHDRIQKMIKNGVIKKFTAIPNYKKIGFPTMVFILVSFLSNPNVSQRELAKRIAKLPGVYEVHIISGEYDLLLKVRGKSLEEIGKLVIDRLRQLKGVGRTLTCACFETVKEET